MFIIFIREGKHKRLANIILMSNTENYFDAQEERCAELLEEFNDQLKWFEGLTANTRLSEIDFTCTDKKHRKCHVELKERKGNVQDYIDYGDVLIEVGKLHATTRIMESGHSFNEQRLYINFVDDGVIIFNLNNISHMKFYPNHKQRNYGKGTTEREDRLGLPISNAIIYKKNNGRYNTERFKQWEIT